MVNGILYSPKFKYLAYFCAKSGCSSIRNLFVQLHKNELTKSTDDLTLHNANNFFQPPKHINTAAMKKYIVVRNPYTRAISMYMNKFIGKNSNIKTSMREKKIENPIAGESFLSFLKLLKHLKSKKLLNRVDGHMYEQVCGLAEKPDEIVVVKLENIDEELPHFYKHILGSNELFNKTQKMFKKDNMHINKTKHKNSNVKNVTNHEFLDNKAAAPPYEAFYNREARDLVYEIYHEDFKRFGYPKELPF